MPLELRLKIAKEYLEVLSETGERKTALLLMSKKHHVTGRSIENYVAEYRGKKVKVFHRKGRAKKRRTR